MKILPDLREAQNRLRHPARQHVEGDQFADTHIAADHGFRAEEQNGGGHQLADQLNALTRPVADVGNAEAGTDITGELFFPAPLHLRLDRQGLQRFDAGDAFDQKGLVLRAAIEFFIEAAAKDRRHDRRNRDVERKRQQ